MTLDGFISNDSFHYLTNFLVTLLLRVEISVLLRALILSPETTFWIELVIKN